MPVNAGLVVLAGRLPSQARSGAKPPLAAAWAGADGTMCPPLTPVLGRVVMLTAELVRGTEQLTTIV